LHFSEEKAGARRVWEYVRSGMNLRTPFCG
jgi:hypothetical protein